MKTINLNSFTGCLIDNDMPVYYSEGKIIPFPEYFDKYAEEIKAGDLNDMLHKEVITAADTLCVKYPDGKIEENKSVFTEKLYNDYRYDDAPECRSYILVDFHGAQAKVFLAGSRIKALRMV